MREASLYAPIKEFLENQNYVVKAEIGACDIMAIRDDDPPVIVELKTRFSLALFHQGIARQMVTDTVYLAVPRGKGKNWRRTLKSNISLCRRLGLGLLTVRLADSFVEAHLDPTAFKPRKSKTRIAQLLREFERRRGDPNIGGSTRATLVTAYRQDARLLAAALATIGQSTGANLVKETSVTTATRILADNHYGWFERVERGVYSLTDKGRKEGQLSN